MVHIAPQRHDKNESARARYTTCAMATQIPAGGFISDARGSPFDDTFDVMLARYAAPIGDMRGFTKSFAHHHAKESRARYADDDDECAPPAKRARV